MGAKPGACACEVRAMGVTLRFARARGDRGVIQPAPTPLVARGFSSGSRT